MQQRRLSDQHANLIAEIATCARRQAKSRSTAFSEKQLVQQYFADVADEDLTDQPPKDMAALALAHLEFANKRARGVSLIRVLNPTLKTDGWDSGNTIVQIVNDDMPFLVDSSAMALNRLGISTLLIMHPVLAIKRTKSGVLKQLVDANDNDPDILESFIHIEIPRETNKQRLEQIRQELEATFQDVRAAVEDWPLMRERLIAASAHLEATGPSYRGQKREACALLNWMADDNFTLLGYREYDIKRGNKTDQSIARPGTGLGILRGDGSGKPHILAREARAAARSKEPLVITKANSVSTVHRASNLDYIGVKVFDRNGLPCAEQRFLGLFTSVAYSQSPREIPLLRLKVERVMKLSGLASTSHRGKALQHILDNFPRDELFQASIDDLQRTASGILNLQERPRVRLFLRRDNFRRFFSCLVFVPREKYNTSVRKRIEAILREGFQGDNAETQVALSESTLARLHIIIHTDPQRRRRVDIADIQAEIAEAVLTWTDKLRAALLERCDETLALQLLHDFENAFPAAYQEDVNPIQASYDIRKLATVTAGETSLELSLYRPPGLDSSSLRFKVFHTGETIPLSEILPMLEHMGLRVISERPYHLRSPAGLWIQDFELELRGGGNVVPEEIADRFQSCFRAVLSRRAEDDGFNSLVIAAGLTWRETAVVRAYCKYLVQTGLPFSQAYMQEVLARYPDLSRTLIDQFQARLNPGRTQAEREHQLEEIKRRLDEQLATVGSLDEDRILRGFVDTGAATLRTNFFQHDASGNPKSYISLKLDPSRINELPRPRPKFEIFVYSPRVEGVHLRGGSIARGGIRWSDRREDFRTEVLGLMKAQQVKNTVIVPTGAKGGFVCKQLPLGDRNAVQAEVVECYRTFIRGLLDITDNLVEDKVAPPADVVRLDADDPYLVVAADKGTATFSDIANAISAEYNFWLADAFASGGSVGYDHKGMAITARGAWEAVRRHFRELGIDTQEQRFTVAGIGDMSGDVFGNGMLLSPHIRLQAAFNHLHIFLDPDPDPDRGFKERQRLFDLPRSSWDDYDRGLLSSGGGIYARTSKSIELEPAAQAMLGLDTPRVTPPQLIQAILRMRVDLLWNGGIGTYVKASRESHADAGDRSNDAVRINANELRCRVVGEGGNLGLTQVGRIEYAQAGGRINTDFIDNSGGVDCSDREVNIKILLNQAMSKGELTLRRRNSLLARMTDEVGTQVLRNNYLQTQSLSMMQSRAKERLSEHGRLIRILENTGLLDRGLEFLPTEEEIEERRKTEKGLTRPELSIMLSYSKIDLFQRLVASAVPEDDFLAGELSDYFPKPLRKSYAALIPQHRLRREIIAMLIGGSIINRMGPMFVLRTVEETGANAAQVAKAYTICREIFNLRPMWRSIEELDNIIQSDVQYGLMFRTSRLLRRAVYWLLGHHGDNLAIEPLVKHLGPGVRTVSAKLVKCLSGSAQKKHARNVQQYIEVGLPETLANHVAALDAVPAILDIVEIAEQLRLGVEDVAKLYFELGRGLRLDWIRNQIEALTVEGRWRAVARSTLRETLLEQQRTLLAGILGSRGRETPQAAMADWLTENKDGIHRLKQALKDMQTAGAIDFATLSVALNEVRRLCQAKRPD